MPLPVLFVDDSAVARAVTKRRLELRGFTVTLVNCASDVDAVIGFRFSAALLDVDLGDGYGTEVAARLREQEPGLPIAFLTGGELPELLDAARCFGPIFPKTPTIDEALAWLLGTV